MDGHGEGEDKFSNFPSFFFLFPSIPKMCVPEEMNNLPIIMTSAKRQEAVVVAMFRRRRRRGRTRKWENIGGVNRVQAIVRRAAATERPSAKLDPVVPADAKRLGRHLLQSMTKIHSFNHRTI